MALSERKHAGFNGSVEPDRRPALRGIVGSQNFANVFNSGTLIDPNSTVTSAIVIELYNQGLGHPPTQSTLNGWLGTSWTMAQAFQEMATSQTYIQNTQAVIQQYLTAAADNALSGP